MNSAATTAVAIFAVAMLATVALGIWSGRGRERSLTEWSVSGRGLGTVFVLLLMAGETYTSFSFLGAAGWSYSHGVPILYLIAYLGIGLAVGYRVGPALWTYCSRHDLLSIADIAEHRFGSRRFGTVVALIATVFLIPYVQLQIQGMGVVVQEMTYHAVSPKVAAVIAFVVTESFVLVSGLRGSAWVSTLKDGLVVAVVAFLAWFVPQHFFGGIGGLLHRMVLDKPTWLVFPGAGHGTFGAAWFVSTILLNAVTLSVFPTTVAGYLGAGSANAIRRNSMLLPWYQLLLLVPIAIGATALFVMPGLKNPDLALFEVVMHSLPSWAVAVIGVAAALSAIVPMSVFMLAIGTLWGKPILAGPNTRSTNGGLFRARLVTLTVGAIALGGSLFAPKGLVLLSVLSYEGIAQLVPSVLLALYRPNVTATGALAGLGVGIAVVLSLHWLGRDPLFGINGGTIALLANLVVVFTISSLSRSQERKARLDQ
jgi:solute:Na+ symporter, SSS family